MEKMSFSIFEAVRMNNVAFFQYIVEKNPSIVIEEVRRDDKNLRDTVLHLATKLGHKEIAERIIELCPSLVSSINSNGDTPLHCAACNGQMTRIVDRMLKCVEADCRTVNNKGETAFFIACRHKNGEAAKIILTHMNYIRRADASGAISVMVDSRYTDMVNKDGLTPLHFAAMGGWVEIIGEFLQKAPSSFGARTLVTNETVFHLAARHKSFDAFIFMAQRSNLLKLLYELDKDGNTVLHAAASVNCISLVQYIIRETSIAVTAKNNLGFVALDLLSIDENYLRISSWLRHDQDVIQNPPADPRGCIKERLLKQMVDARKVTNKERKMHSEALQNAKNTITIVAVLIASVAFTCGINPPGGVHQDGPFIGKSTAGRTLAFKVFTISNNIALFTSLCIVILLVSIIPYKTKSLKKFLVIAHRMMWVAVTSMASAYAAAAWVTLPHFGGTIWLVYITLGIASTTLGGMLLFLLFKIIKHMLRKTELRQNVISPMGMPTNSVLSDLEAGRAEGYYIY